MISKYQQITELYEHTAEKIFFTPANWTAFLKAACHNYKCAFNNQILIYAQRPDATAVLELDAWNNKFYRWVNKGAKGIAVFGNTEDKHLKYFFDIADTHESKRSVPVPLWYIDKSYENLISQRLINTFGEFHDISSFTDILISACDNAVEDNIDEYPSDFYRCYNGEIADVLDADTVKDTYRYAVCNCVDYMVLTRCGYNADEYIDISEFINVTLFNTKSVRAAFGTAINEISKMILSEIENVCLNQQTIFQNQGNLLDKSDINLYNELTANNERNDENYGVDLSSGRGLSNPESGIAGRRNEHNIGTLRTAQDEVSSGTQEGNIQSAPVDRKADAALPGDRTAGGNNAFKSDKSDEEGTGNNRGTQSSGSNGMGGTDEQHPAFGGGNSPERSDLQLNKENKADGAELPAFSYNTDIAYLKTVSQQMSFFDYNVYELPQQIIDEALCLGGNKPNSLERICAHFSKDYPSETNAAFLREEYGRDGKGFFFDNRLISVWYDENGIRIAEGRSANGSGATALSWKDAAKRIRELLDLGRYVPQTVLDQSDPNEKKEISQKLWYVLQDFRTEAQDTGYLPSIQEIYNLRNGFPEATAKIHELLNDSSMVDSLVNEMSDFLKAYNQNKGLLRFNYHRPEKLLEMLQGLQRTPIVFTAQDSYSFNPQQFITNDEIDKLLIGGSDISERKLDIYSFFLNDHTSKERADYLKHQYGVGGWGYSGFIENHDSKGISYSRVSMGCPYDKVLLPWNKVENRIGELIRDNRYMSEKELEYIPVYERNKIASAVYFFFSGVPADSCPFKYNPDYWEGIKEICNLLSDPEKLGEIYKAMLPVYESTLPDDRYYSTRKQGIEYLSAFKDGTFSLFGKSSFNPSIYSKQQSYSDDDESDDEQEEHDVQDVDEIYESEVGDEPSEAPDETAAPAEKYNFRITNDELGYGGVKDKYYNNFEAIKLLKQLDNENRSARLDEQEILSNYVGWGGLSDVFDSSKSAWIKEYSQLKALLSDDEYASARESTLTAFYTPPVVIRAIYKAIENMGFKRGNILEPCCGTGNFLGMLPETMKDSKMFGIELDSISGRIAQQLYQKSNITVEGFEKSNLPDSFFDIAVGNVPFGQFKVSDKRYDKNNFLIHDYFFAKTLDKVRSGGIIAFVTSKGTMDKENCSVRRYIAQRAELLGAIRLPSNTFKANAGTDVTSDILFLQKRDRIIETDPDWVHLGQDENGITMNSYFVDNPDMILGKMVMVSTQYGMDSSCRSNGKNLDELLTEAIGKIKADYTESNIVAEDNEISDSIPADPNVRNFSFTIYDGEVYYRENSQMKKVQSSGMGMKRIRGMIELRDCVRNLINYQTDGYSDEQIKAEQAKLNRLYDDFSKKCGLINFSANYQVFSQDSSYYLLCSLENIDEETGKLKSKADIFTKRTIAPHKAVTSVDTASEALAVSISEKACVDMNYMSQLYGKSSDEIENELKGVIFRNPVLSESTPHFETSDEYLSGNVREKLRIARTYASMWPHFYSVNVSALEAVQPEDLKASDISVNLGAVWVPADYIKQFVFNLLEPTGYTTKYINVNYTSFTSQWTVAGKNTDYGNVKAFSTYGTKRINAYEIIEDSLNLKDVRIFDYVTDENGNKKAILNKNETTIAQQKQELIKDKFREWIWNDPERREALCRIYNDRFNSIRPREYDGSHIQFVGMNPEIKLMTHQINAVAHEMYGGNTLLAHVVGAGKTFEMVAAAMESKRLGLCHKSMFVVPNHLIGQWASEFLQLYPAANILVSSKKDFETKNRKKFCGRIATGDYDAVIIGHSQFEKLPMSIEHQVNILQEQMNEILEGLSDLKNNKGDSITIKQLEKTRKSLEAKLEKLNNQSRKDDVITFEQLGVDKLFVDEAHYYKNLFLYTKMRNVGGIAQTEAKKSSDLFMKCRYLDDLTGGRGVVFATGTPISNSMVEMYTLQRYLQYNTLTQLGLQHFDAWASSFGVTVTAIELSPEGTGYRAKTRFAQFYNLPELMSIFKEVADIKTADMLNLPVPEAEFHNVVLHPSDIQKEMVAKLSERADDVRNKRVESNVDNMLCITNDGRKLALDQRLMNEALPDFEGSKVSACADNVYNIWEQYKEQKSTQLVFCDLSTPHYDGSFNVYDELKNNLIAKGVPPEEIAFIHDADTDAKKKELFSKVRAGSVRVMIGSTQKMGAGTNVQNKLIASHDLDCPWRPSDLEQRLGRTVRQGNENPNVHIFRYVTENTFDAYLYQIIENKQKFISQIMTSKSPVRSANDIDEASLSYAEIKALATGNPFIKEKMDLDIAVSKLKLYKANYLSQKYDLEDKIRKYYPKEIDECKRFITGFEKDIQVVKEHAIVPEEDKISPFEIKGITYTEKKQAEKALVEACAVLKDLNSVKVGQYKGFSVYLKMESFIPQGYTVCLKNALSHTIDITSINNVGRIDNLFGKFEDNLSGYKQMLLSLEKQFETAKIEVLKPFEKEDELTDKQTRLNELNVLLNLDHAENEVVDSIITEGKDDTVNTNISDEGEDEESESAGMSM